METDRMRYYLRSEAGTARPLARLDSVGVTRLDVKRATAPNVLNHLLHRQCAIPGAFVLARLKSMVESKWHT